MYQMFEIICRRQAATTAAGGRPWRTRAAQITTAAAVICAATVNPTAAADLPLAGCPQTGSVLNPESVMAHPDCRLHSNDRVDLTYNVSYWPARAVRPQAVKVVVTDGSNEVVQTINEALEPSSPSPVGLQDLDGDGRDELIVPMARYQVNGSLNTRFAVWRADGDRKHLERTQMVGQAVYASSDGYVVTNGGALSSRDLTFYLPTGAGFTLIVVLTIEAEEIEPGTQRVMKVSCRAHQEDGLHAVDMDVYQAEDTFCVSPAANAIWPGAERVTIRPWPRWGQ